jgi:hypothetical protein
LNDLCDADVLIHIVDASGFSDKEGVTSEEPTGYGLCTVLLFFNASVWFARLEAERALLSAPLPAVSPSCVAFLCRLLSKIVVV